MNLSLPGSAEFTGQLYLLCERCKGNDTLLDLDGVSLEELPYELADAGWRDGICPDCKDHSKCTGDIDFDGAKEQRIQADIEAANLSNS